ncbi:unnamed protein product [Ixodes persulcatus]
MVPSCSVADCFNISGGQKSVPCDFRRSLGYFSTILSHRDGWIAITPKRSLFDGSFHRVPPEVPSFVSGPRQSSEIVKIQHQPLRYRLPSHAFISCKYFKVPSFVVFPGRLKLPTNGKGPDPQQRGVIHLHNFSGTYSRLEMLDRRRERCIA